MSAMHAMALPENDPDSQAAAICRFHGQTMRSRAARGQARAGETASVPAPAGTADGRAPARQATSSRVIAGQPARNQGSASATARGRAAPAAPAATIRPATIRPASRRPASISPASGHAASRQASAAAPLRLTRRGRVVIAAAAALLVIVVSLIAAGAAQATSHPVPPRLAGQNLSRVIVRPGQTLWSVAKSADPGADTRLVVQQIVDLNGLTSDAVLAGQRLWVPRG